MGDRLQIDTHLNIGDAVVKRIVAYRSVLEQKFAGPAVARWQEESEVEGLGQLLRQRIEQTLLDVPDELVQGDHQALLKRKAGKKSLPTHRYIPVPWSASEVVR